VQLDHRRRVAQYGGVGVGQLVECLPEGFDHETH